MNTQKPAMKLQPSPNNAGRWMLDGHELETGDTIVIDYFNLWHLATVEFDKEQNIYVLAMPWGAIPIDGQRARRA